MIDTESDTFRDWLEDMAARLARFEDFQAPEDLVTDYSADSLGRLEEYLLGRWPDRQSFEAEADLDFTDGAVRYIGETFLRAGGGGWHFSDAEGFAFAGRPFIQLDTMDRTPISPYNLITALLSRRTGRELTKVYGFQQENVDERRAEEAEGWRPRRDPVPGVTDGSDETPAPELRSWLDAIPGRLESLRARAGERSPQLDLSPASLPVLAELVLAEFADAEQFSGAGERSAEACSYLGEVIRRAAGGDWVLRPGEPDEKNPFVGRPYLMRTDDRGDLRTVVPSVRLERLVAERDPELLTGALRKYA